MTITGIASRYALALVDAISTPTAGIEPYAALEGLNSFADTMTEAHDLELILLSPSVSQKRKRAVIEKISGDLGVHRLIKNFLLVLNDHRRMGMLREAARQAGVLLDERLGFVRADVFAAAQMEPQDEAMLAGKLAQITGKQVKIRVAIDPNLIGGILARVGSTVYDGSVRGQLRALCERLSSE